MATNKLSVNTNSGPLTILGVHINSDAYPNVKYRVASLLQAKNLVTREINFPLRRLQSFGQEKSRIRTALWWLASTVRFLSAHLQVVFASIKLSHPQRVYVPYPAVFVLFLLSVLPKRWRPDKIYADVFISIYDTVITDRRIISSRNPLAKLLYKIERRAYQYADTIFVDTVQNARSISDIFKIQPHKVISLPLAINEEVYEPQQYAVQGKRCNVLFTGTFIPLQGVEVIAHAVTLLKDHNDIHFRLVGDGQTSTAVSAILKHAGCSNFSWERGWKSAAELAEEIRQSDICLGIFGTGDKTQRVWPLKNYAYMAVGRAIITGDTDTARTILADYAGNSFMTVVPGQPVELAQAIVDLAKDEERRMHLAINARLHFEKKFAGAVSFEELMRELSR